MTDKRTPADLYEDDGELYLVERDETGIYHIRRLGPIERAEDDVPECLGLRYANLLCDYLDGVATGEAYRAEVCATYRTAKGF